MRKLNEKLMEGLGGFAQLEDVDAGGYLDPQEALAIQRFQHDVLADCEAIATELLHPDNSSALAKDKVRKAFDEIGRATSTGEFTADELALVKRYKAEIDQRIDRLASKSDWQRAFNRAYHRTPEFIRNWIFVFLVVGIIVAIVSAVSS